MKRLHHDAGLCQYCREPRWLRSVTFGNLTIAWGNSRHRDASFFPCRTTGTGPWFDIRWSTPLSGMIVGPR